MFAPISRTPQRLTPPLTKAILFGIFLLLSSCQQQQYYEISGSADIQVGATPPLVKLRLNNITIDSAYVRNGRFLLKGRYLDSLSQNIAYLQVMDEAPVPLILTPAPLSYDFTTRRLIQGDSLNIELEQLYNSLDSIGLIFKKKLASTPHQGSLFNTFNDSFKVSIESYISLAQKSCLRHPDDPIGIISALMLLTINSENLFKMAPFIRQHMGPLVLNNPEIARYLTIVDNYYHTSPGEKSLNAPLQTIDGEPTELFDHLDPLCYTLLHYWAGWCRPCLEEICNLTEAYNVYHHQGLNVISIFIWDYLYVLRSLKDEYQLPWTLLYDPDSSSSITYGIYSIPEIMLIAPDKTIVARSLRGLELLDALDSIFGH